MFWMGPIFATCFAYGSAAGPAAVSTRRGRLYEALNDCRVRDGSNEIDERVSTLPGTLKSANGGQGIGFTMAGTVVDKRLLNQLLVLFFVPLMLPTELAPRDEALLAAAADNTALEASLASLRTDVAQLNLTCYRK